MIEVCDLCFELFWPLFLMHFGQDFFQILLWYTKTQYWRNLAIKMEENLWKKHFLAETCLTIVGIGKNQYNIQPLWY